MSYFSISDNSILYLNLTSLVALFIVVDHCVGIETGLVLESNFLVSARVLYVFSELRVFIYPDLIHIIG